MQKVIKWEPNDPLNYHLLGLAQLQAGQAIQAEQSYRMALPHLDEETRTYMLADLTSLAQEEPELAEIISDITATLEAAPIP